jgi:hypothetical protein
MTTRTTWPMPHDPPEDWIRRTIEEELSAYDSSDWATMDVTVRDVDGHFRRVNLYAVLRQAMRPVWEGMWIEQQEHRVCWPQ